MTQSMDFTSQAYFRNPAAGIEKLRAAGPVVEVKFPLVGKVWTTTTQDLADRVLKDSETFSLRKDDGSVAGFQWRMPGIVRTLANNMLSMDEPDHRRLRDIAARVDDIIRTQKFEGAAAELLSSNIVARDLGLTDKHEIETTHRFDALSDEELTFEMRRMMDDTPVNSDFGTLMLEWAQSRGGVVKPSRES